LNVGQIIESAIGPREKENGMTSLLSRTDADRIGRNNFIKSALTFDIERPFVIEL
jgi:hypothetical protein